MTLAQAYKEQFGKVLYPYKIYDTNGNVTYYEYSNGYWWKSEYDANGNKTYYETSNGFWWKREYYEDSTGYWAKYKYNANGNRTYYETSNGVKHGKNQSSCDGKIVEVDGKKYKLKELY